MLVRRRGGPHVKVVDLGIAKVVEEQELRSRRSALIGTPVYMAPEVIATEDFAPSGYFIADIYAVGVILYEAVTGFPPFSGEPAQVMYQKVVGSAPPMGPRLRGASVPGAFEALIMRSLERRPEERPASMEALASELRGVRSSCTDGGGVEVESLGGFAEVLPAADTDGDRALPISLEHEGEWSLSTAGDARFVVYAKHIRTHERGPHTLGMSRIPGILPGRLRCTYSNSTLSLKVDADDGRSALYLDAFQPATRMEQLLLAPSSPAQSFDVGHRRARVRRVNAQALRVVEGGVEAPLTEPARRLHLTVPPWVSTVVVLETFGEDRSTRHIECICLEHPT
jgi:serine/threonine protein kinase